MHKTPETVDALFEEDLLNEEDLTNVLEDDLDDALLEHLEDNRKISIFDSEFVLEGDNNYDE